MDLVGVLYASSAPGTVVLQVDVYGTYLKTGPLDPDLAEKVANHVNTHGIRLHLEDDQGEGEQDGVAYWRLTADAILPGDQFHPGQAITFASDYLRPFRAEYLASEWNKRFAAGNLSTENL